MRTIDRVLLAVALLTSLYLLARDQGVQFRRHLDLPSSATATEAADVSDLPTGKKYAVVQKVAEDTEGTYVVLVRYYWVREEGTQHLYLIHTDARRGYRDDLPDRFLVLANPLASQGYVRATVQPIQ